MESVLVKMCGKMINNIGKREMFAGISGPQDSAQNVTKIVDIFTLFLAKHTLDRL